MLITAIKKCTVALSIIYDQGKDSEILLSDQGEQSSFSMGTEQAVLIINPVNECCTSYYDNF